MTKKEQIAEKIKILKQKGIELKQKFIELPMHKKVVISLLFLAGIVFILGTLAIIIESIFNINSRPDISQEEVVEELETLDEDITNLLEKYNFESLEERHEELDDEFKLYEDDLKEADELLDLFELPLSSPINE